MDFIKAHAYGNDFLFVQRHELRDRDIASTARRLCDRHTGIGADGLIAYDFTERGASMRLRNADGSRAEVSGNGVRCLAAIVVAKRQSMSAQAIVVDTESGEKQLLLERMEAGRYVFRASMGLPTGIEERTIEAAGERVRAVTLSVGNPQCIVLGKLDEARFLKLGPALERHPMFPDQTNVEFVHVESPGQLRILIWERGCGPTQASGTGACASAVAAAAYGGASRDVTVTSPGGSQRVEWRDDAIYLTGWAEITVEGRWLGSADYTGTK